MIHLLWMARYISSISLLMLLFHLYWLCSAIALSLKDAEKSTGKAQPQMNLLYPSVSSSSSTPQQKGREPRKVFACNPQAILHLQCWNCYMRVCIFCMICVVAVHGFCLKFALHWCLKFTIGALFEGPCSLWLWSRGGQWVDIQSRRSYWNSWWQVVVQISYFISVVYNIARAWLTK